MKHATVLLLVACALIGAGGTAWGQLSYSFSSTAGGSVDATIGNAFTWNTTTANDEEYSTATAIGFNFAYAGTTFTEFQVSTNGFIRLGNGLASATSADALSGVLRSIIAPLWDNLAVSATATDITYVLAGTSGSQILTVKWRNMKWNSTAAATNAEFDVKLFEGTNVIQFVYGTMGTPTAGSASIGLADNTVISTAGSATGKFFSINVGGVGGARAYHQSMNYPFSGINNAPDAGTVMTFTPVTPSPIPAGSYHVAGGVPYFATLSDAAVALNVNGISGPVVLEVADGTYDDIFHLNAVAGTSATNTITLKASPGATVTLSPKNGSGTSTAASAATSDAIIRMEGTQYTTIENLSLVDNGLATVALKFEGGVYLGNSALNGTMITGGRFNTFRNVSIDMKSTVGTNHAGSTGFRYFTSSSTETDSSKATSYNRIENCTVTGFWRSAWKSFGISGTNPDRGNVISGCTLGGVSVPSGTGSDIRAIEADCQANITIENNTIQNLDAAIMTTNSVYGIWLNPASSTTNLNSGTIIIRGNTIKNLTNSGTSTTTGFAVGIGCNGVATGTDIQIYKNRVYNLYTNGSTTCRAEGLFLNIATATSSTITIHNNMVSDLRAPRSTSGPAVRGFDLQNGGGGGAFSVLFNTVSLDDAVPPTVANHQSGCIYFASFGTSSLDLRNNILINTMSTNGTGRAIALYASANSNLIRLTSSSDYNNYYVGIGSATRGVSTDVTNIYQTLGAHQAAVATGGLGGPRDVNSKSVAVNFVSSADLHLSAGSIGDANLKGSPIASYTTDIDGDIRDLMAPYIGADERPEAQLPVQLASFSAAVNQQSSHVVLNWRTISEVNNYGFYVQRRGFNGEFADLNGSFIAGHGTTNEPHDYTWTDMSAGSGTWYYRLRQVDLDGSIHFSDQVQVDLLTSVASTTPASYSLAQNYPNPFNPSTTIRFEIAKPEFVTLKIYDMLGREIRTLANEQLSAGSYSMPFNATGLASGTYIYRLQAGSFVATKKMSLMK